MDIVGIISISVAWGGIVYIVYDIVSGRRFFKHKSALGGRVVRLDAGYCNKQQIEQYATINIVTQEQKRKIVEVEVKCTPLPEYYAENKKTYDEEFKQTMKSYELQLKRYNKLTKTLPSSQVQQYQSAYHQFKSSGTISGYNPYSQYVNQYVEYFPPQKPIYNFYGSSRTIYRTVSKKLTRLMPKNFDIQTQSIIKPITGRKGVKQKNHMPRIFKYLFLLAGVIIALSVAITLSNMMPQLMHQWFIGK